MKKYTLYIGLNDKDSKVQEISTLEAFKMVQKVLLSLTDGATIFEADGIYRHEDGSFTTEKTLRVELMFIEEPVVRQIVSMIKAMLNQESIAVQFEEIISELW